MDVVNDFCQQWRSWVFIASCCNSFLQKQPFSKKSVVCLQKVFLSYNYLLSREKIGVEYRLWLYRLWSFQRGQNNLNKVWQTIWRNYFAFEPVCAHSLTRFHLYSDFYFAYSPYLSHAIKKRALVYFSGWTLKIH